MKLIKRLFLRIASSFTLNFIMMIVFLVLGLFDIGNVWVWRFISLYLILCVLFLNANYFRYIKHKYNS